MTYQEADRLVTILHMNFANFLPPSPEASAVKKGMWCGELQKYDYKRGMKAIEMLIQTQQYPPTIADMKQYLGMGLTRQDVEARQYLPFDPTKVYYPSDIKIESSFERAMRMINEVKA